MFKISMSFFGEEAPAESVESVPQETAQTDAQTGDNTASGNDTAEQQKTPEKTFTQSEMDKIITERLSRQKAKFEEEKLEAAKLAKMNAEQKAQYESEKRIKDIERREAEVTQRELRATAAGILVEKKLPASLIDCLTLTDADACNKSIEAISKAFSDAVAAQVDQRLRSEPPKTGTTNKGSDPFLDGWGV